MGHGNEATHHKAIRLFLMAMIPALLPTDHVVTQQLSPLLPSPPSPTLLAPLTPLSSPLSLSYTTSSPLSSPLPSLPSLPLLHYQLPSLPSPPLSPSPTLLAPLSSPLLPSLPLLHYRLPSLPSPPRSPSLPSLPLLHYRLTTSHAKYTADETMYPAQTANVSRFQRIVHMVTCHPFPMRISTRIRSQSANLLHTSPM